MVVSVAKTLNLIPNDFSMESPQDEKVSSLLIGLEKKLQSVFQDDSQKIFDFSEEKLKQFREKDFKPKCEAALKNIEDNEEKIELFLDNVDQPDFIRFLRAIVKL
jgi:hypothetical protein